jgi:hypothetical protein
MKPIDVSLRPSLFETASEGQDGGGVQISLTVEPSRVEVPGRARVVVRVLRKGRPLDGFPVSISASRGQLSRRKGATRSGVVAAELQGRPDDVGVALVRVHSDVWEAQAVLSAGLEFVR